MIVFILVHNPDDVFPFQYIEIGSNQGVCNGCTYFSLSNM